MKTTACAADGEERDYYPGFEPTCSYETPGRKDAVLIHPPEAEPGDEAWIAVDEEFSVQIERTR